MVELDVPEFNRFRKVIDKIRNARDRNMFKLIYLTAARESEVCTKVTKGDDTKAYGNFLSWQITKFKTPKDTFIIKVAILKRKTKDPATPKFRYVALPIHPSLEPWTGDLIKYMAKQRIENNVPLSLSINLTRARIYQLVRDTLYPKFGIKPNHEEHFCNILRHFRVTHLVSEYNFGILDLVAYCGWSVKTAAGNMGMPSGQSNLYLHLKWRAYYPKLLIPLSKLLV